MILRGLAALAVIFPACAWTQAVRVDVFQLFHPTELRVANAEGSTVVVIGGGNQVDLSDERGHGSVLLRLNHGQLLLNEAPVISIQARSRSGEGVDFTLSVPGRIARRYHGVLTVTAKPHQLEPTVTMDIETAVASVVAAEDPASMPLEAMKAQAVVARSFFHAGGRHGEDEFCDTTHCQFLREAPPPSSQAWVATHATRGLVLTWRDQPLAAMYASRCGGRTRTLREIGSPVHGYPYFSVECSYCRRHPSAWTRALSTVDGRALGQSKESARLALDRVHGWSAIPSDDYVLTSGAQGVTVQGRGRGHGLGLCQFGAAGMAADGADFATILRHYYPETELASIADQPASR
jgi:stage II sporulation protein D